MDASVYIHLRLNFLNGFRINPVDTYNSKEHESNKMEVNATSESLK